ncbi:MAG: hypothetical protein JXQ75_10540 [Phycisphaerae bacterium]|nr:hypothetical protein [Phycisphaerae bacterium]
MNASARSFFMITTILVLGLLGSGKTVAAPPSDGPATSTPATTTDSVPAAERDSAGGDTVRKDVAERMEELRPIRVAVFDMDVLEDVELKPAALTDLVNAMMAGMDKVTVVNRDQIKKVADEHRIALSGLVDTASAVELGKFVSAQYVVVGRASRIGQSYYLVLKIVDVATTVQTTVSAKSLVEKGVETLIERLDVALSPQIRRLQKPVEKPDDPMWAKVREAAKVLAGKVVLVSVSEQHINRPLTDPAAQMAIADRLRKLNVEVIVPEEPIPGWKGQLLEVGKYSDEKVDYLIEGDGTSAHAAEIHGLISCRARVELRLIKVPGRKVTVTEKGVAARVDLVETLAAKAALEDAGVSALDAVVLKLAEQVARENQ